MTDRQQISDWFDEGVGKSATHMIVVCDTYDHDDYPVFATSDDDCIQKHQFYNTAPMQRVMEVYDLRQPKDRQMSERRSLNIPTPRVAP
jgi:hypothetical protein